MQTFNGSPPLFVQSQVGTPIFSQKRYHSMLSGSWQARTWLRVSLRIIEISHIWERIPSTSVQCIGFNMRWHQLVNRQIIPKLWKFTPSKHHTKIGTLQDFYDGFVKVKVETQRIPEVMAKWGCFNVQKGIVLRNESTWAFSIIILQLEEVLHNDKIGLRLSILCRAWVTFTKFHTSHKSMFCTLGRIDALALVLAMVFTSSS